DGPFTADYVLSALRNSLAAEWLPHFRDAGAVIIDNSSYFRMHSDVPLVVPEVNADALKHHKGLVANPNCTAAIASVALAPLHRAFHLNRLIMSTYQSVSGSGQKAVVELEKEIADVSSQPSVFPHRIAFNLFPQIGSFNDKGLCVEEEKIGEELRKILSAPELFISVTTVRVPVRVGHSLSIFAEFEKPVTTASAYEQLHDAPGLIAMENQNYATPLLCEGRDEVFAGRLRAYPENPHALSLWVVGDNLLKGAALNAVQILEKLL
ncbi:aspartate-semialdehyde dehydrogenase, partial [bacterium]|nr:aspartate-semialdehyde dehydrogenase [bacterium]